MKNKVAMAVLAISFLGGTISSQLMASERFDPAYASIGQLRTALDAGRLTSEQLVAFYLERIERFDKQGPRINALISLNRSALRQARELDSGLKETRNKGRLLGNDPLRGIPFIVKDNFDTAGIATSGGSAALRRSVPRSNAFVVQKLTDQGAILIGKANMSELAASYGRLGYSSAGGLTVNPYNTARDVSGSSSGSAAAVAADFAAFALGTDTAGSVRGPANVAGLVGLRPTPGLISRSGVIPLSLTFDTSGILARSVADLALVLDAIAGADPADEATRLRPGHATYAAALPGSGLKGARLGVIANFRGANAEVDAAERESLRRLERQGAMLVTVNLPAQFMRLWAEVLGPVGEAEFKPQFERYLRTLSAQQPHSLAELIGISAGADIQESATPVNPKRLAALRAADASALTDSPTYIRILTETIPALRRQLLDMMVSQGLDAFVFSTMSCPAAPRFDRPDSTYRCDTDDSYRPSYLASAAGLPEITVPSGRILGGLPVGYSFMGAPYGEEKLLALAHAFEAVVPRLPTPALAERGRTE